ncbi:MAG: DUF3820 family protein [Deltaproteobacteria bacterium]|nr:DUF3820 family protein [Deltaproteobacteria bacterium]
MSTATNDREMRMPFGKFKGVPIGEIETSYLQWLSTIELRDPLRGAVNAALNWKAAPMASGVGSTTPGAGNANVEHPTRSEAGLKGSQGTFPGHDAEKPKHRAWIPRPESEDLSAYYSQGSNDGIPW